MSNESVTNTVAPVSFDWLPWSPMLLAFPAAGGVVGWLTGASQTPVVATVVPLIFGLLGAVAYGYLDQFVKRQSLAERLEKLKLDEQLTMKLRLALELHEQPRWLPAFWGLGVIGFCAVLWIGLQYGLNQRVPHYPAFESMLSASKISSKEMPAEDHALMFRLYLDAQMMKIPEDEVQQLFTNIILKALSEDATQGQRDKDHQICLEALSKIAERDPATSSAFFPKRIDELKLTEDSVQDIALSVRKYLETAWQTEYPPTTLEKVSTLVVAGKKPTLETTSPVSLPINSPSVSRPDNGRF